MKEIVDYLTKLDFSKVEIKLYLTLLKHGSMTVAELARKADINRTAAYTHVQSLFKKGVLITAKGKKNEISTTSPESLKYLVENKSNQVKDLESKLPEVINALNISFLPIDPGDESEIKHYQGRNAVKAIYTDCLKSNKIRAYFDITELENIFPENVALFENTIKNNLEMEVYEIAQDSLRARNQITPGHRHYWKFLPSHIKLTSNDILIYDGKVAIINLRSKDDINGVVLNNKDYFNNSVQLFDLLWEFLPKPKL